MWHWFIRSSNICPFLALFTGHVEAVLVWTGRPLLPSLKLALCWIFKFSPNRHFSQSTKCPKSYCWQVFTPPFKQAKKCPFELEFGQHWTFERRFPYQELPLITGTMFLHFIWFFQTSRNIFTTLPCWNTFLICGRGEVLMVAVMVLVLQWIMVVIVWVMVIMMVGNRGWR